MGYRCNSPTLTTDGHCVSCQRGDECLYPPDEFAMIPDDNWEMVQSGGVYRRDYIPGVWFQQADTRTWQ